MNPWGVLIILIGALAIYIGIKGTENGVYAFIFGHAVNAYNNTPFAPGNQGQVQAKSLNPLAPAAFAGQAKQTGTAITSSIPDAVSALQRLLQ